MVSSVLWFFPHYFGGKQLPCDVGIAEGGDLADAEHLGEVERVGARGRFRCPRRLL